MKHYAFNNDIATEPTQKDFWVAAYLAALHRVPQADAMSEADAALAACNERWAYPPFVNTWRYRHMYPLGHLFSDDCDPPDTVSVG
jgi:hypothetical protein